MKWLFLLIVLVPVHAFASSADSGRCPWRLPFTIKIHAVGDLHQYGKAIPTHGPTTYTDKGRIPDSEDVSFTIDTTIAYLHSLAMYQDTGDHIQYALLRDTLRYSYSFYDRIGSSYDSGWLLIAFAEGKDSILSLTFGIRQQTDLSSSQENITQTIAQVSFLAYDDTSIYVTDSCFSAHNVLISNDYASIFYSNPGYGEFGFYNNSDFIASNAVFQGIFRQAYFRRPVLGRNPWHLPKQILIHADGIQDSVGQTSQSSTDLAVTIWKCSLDTQDKFLFQNSIETSDYPLDQDQRDTMVLVTFVSGSDSIQSLIVSLNDSYTKNWQGEVYSWTRSYVFTISSLAYDSTTIFTTDSSLCIHEISLKYTESYPDRSMSNFNATSVDLSGIFQPMQYTCAALVSPLKREDTSFNISSSNNSLICSFPVVAAPSCVEVYSILGARVASFEIPTGTNSATIANLVPGLYWVRIGQLNAKVAIPK